MSQGGGDVLPDVQWLGPFLHAPVCRLQPDSGEDTPDAPGHKATQVRMILLFYSTLITVQVMPVQ